MCFVQESGYIQKYLQTNKNFEIKLIDNMEGFIDLFLGEYYKVLLYKKIQLMYFVNRLM